MPLLLVELQARTRGTQLPPRLLIGRRSMNHLVIDDPTVSRMHAWIDQRGNDYILTDMRSRTGTRVNGQPLAKRRKLLHGDVIQIGPATITFRGEDQLPPGVETLNLPREPNLAPRDVGIRFDCPHCRAPMWASHQYAGHGGICTYCGDGFTIPRTVAAPPGTPTAPTTPASRIAPAPSAPPVYRAPAVPPELPPVQTDNDFMAPIVPLPAPREDAEAALTVATPTAVQTRVAFDADPLAAQPRRGSTNGHNAPSLSPKRPATVAGSATLAGGTEQAVSQELAANDIGTIALPPDVRRATLVEANGNGVGVLPANTPLTRPTRHGEPPTVAKLHKCGVCHSPILAGEAETSCPSCNLKFHAECWQENFGCSAYGCPQVNALAPPSDPAAEDEAALAEATVDVAPPRTPWEHVLLGLSAVSVVASAFTFGAASLVMLVWSFVYLTRSKADPDRKQGPLYGAIALSTAGVAAGAIVSYFLFLYGRG